MFVAVSAMGGKRQGAPPPTFKQIALTTRCYGFRNFPTSFLFRRKAEGPAAARGGPAARTYLI